MATNNINRNSYIKKHNNMYVNNEKVPSEFISSLNLSSVSSNNILNYTGSNWNNIAPNINNIIDLELNNIENGNTIKYSSGWSNNYFSLNDIQDLDIINIQPKEYITYNDSISKWTRSSITLDGLTDTNFTGITTDNTLKYSSGNYIKTDMKIIEDNNKTVIDSTEKSLIIGNLSTTYFPTSITNIRLSPSVGNTTINNVNVVGIGNKASSSYTIGTDNYVIGIGSNANGNNVIRNLGKNSTIGIGKSSLPKADYGVFGIGTLINSSVNECALMGYNINISRPTVAFGTAIRGSIENSSVLRSTLIGHEVNYYNTANSTIPLICIGYRSSYRQAVTSSVGQISIGSYSLSNLSDSYTTAIGYYAGADSMGLTATCVGSNAGGYMQGQSCVAIGNLSGSNTQKYNSVSVGTEAGKEFQKELSIAIGYKAGSNNQGSNSIAIGNMSANNLQGSNSIAIGYDCGSTANNSVVFNASNVSHNLTTTGFFLTPNILTGEAMGYGFGRLFYDTITGELKYSTT